MTVRMAFIGAAPALICALAVTPAAGSAAERKAEPANALKVMLSCRSIGDQAERLACFDRETDALSGRISSGAVAVVDKAEAQRAERARFGLAPSAQSAFVAAGGAPVKELAGTLRAAHADMYGKWVVTLQDGTRWHQIDDYPLTQTPRPGMKVVVRHAALGSFRMVIGGNAAVKVRREA